MRARRLAIGTAVAVAAGCLLWGGPDRAAGEFETRSFESRAGRISAQVAGRPGARRAIFVHGTPGDARAWADYLREPPADREWVAIDRPGFGASDAGAQPSLELQAAALEPLLVRAGGRWPVLIGHSLGGAVIVRAAVDFADRIDGLVVLAGALDPGLERLRWYNHLARPFEFALPRAVRNANRELRPLRAELEALALHLGEVRAPVVIVHGERDALVPFANAEFLRARLTRAARVELIRIEGGGHFIPWEHADRVREAIQRLQPD